jgi:hypothetical protein
MGLYLCHTCAIRSNAGKLHDGAATPPPKAAPARHNRSWRFCARSAHTLTGNWFRKQRGAISLGASSC